MYPAPYRLPEVTAHVVSLLERRRPGAEGWDAAVEARLAGLAREALSEVERQFLEVAADRPYWDRLERSVLDVALPRYLRLARTQHALERRDYGVWRGGDLVARLLWTALAAAVAWVAFRLPSLRWALGPLSLLALVLSPFVPDLQVWAARRRYARALQQLVGDMTAEQRQLEAYRPLDG